MMSARTGNNADERGADWVTRGCLLLLIGYWLLLIIATHIPKVPEPLGFRPSDKLLHLVAYGTLAFLVALAWTRRYAFGLRVSVALLGAVAVHGIFDEVTQPLFGRNADVIDWFADVIGATLGLAAFALARQAWRVWRPLGS